MARVEPYGRADGAVRERRRAQRSRARGEAIAHAAFAALGALVLAAPASAKGPTVECVDAGGNGCAFTTIQAAVDAAPIKGKTIIAIHAGTYAERVRSRKSSW